MNTYSSSITQKNCTNFKISKILRVRDGPTIKLFAFYRQSGLWPLDALKRKSPTTQKDFTTPQFALHAKSTFTTGS